MRQINAKTPYRVELDDETMTFGFVTDICETGDGKQAMRSRLFSYWFNAYEYNTRYSMVTTCIPDNEGIDNFAALIVRLDNPLLVEIVNEFNSTAKILREK